MATSFQPMILAGHEFGTPADFPSNRLDTNPTSSAFNSVGALEINSPLGSYSGSAVALSSRWLLTAGHNLDIDADGAADPNISVIFHLPQVGSFFGKTFYLHEDFSGFGIPTVNDDLALIHLGDELPADLAFPESIIGATVGEEVTLVGFGRSGFGNFGYTSEASLSDRRIGLNVIDSFELDDEGSGKIEIFIYDFDDPSSADSVGNDRETIIGPGDSGGAALVLDAEAYSLVGINTFTEGIGGRFGDTAGGVVVEPYLPWIRETTGLYAIPEPCSVLLLMTTAWALLLSRNR